MKSFSTLIESALGTLTEMPIRAGTNRKSLITRWDNASWESFYGNFDKMKSNSKKYDSYNKAYEAAIALAKKKYEAGKSKVMVDDARTGETIWTPESLKNDKSIPINQHTPKKKEEKAPVAKKKEAAISKKNDMTADFVLFAPAPTHNTYSAGEYHIQIKSNKSLADVKDEIVDIKSSKYNYYKASLSYSSDGKTVELVFPYRFRSGEGVWSEREEVTKGEAESRLKDASKLLTEVLNKKYPGITITGNNEIHKSQDEKDDDASTELKASNKDKIVIGALSTDRATIRISQKDNTMSIQDIAKQLVEKHKVLAQNAPGNVKEKFQIIASNAHLKPDQLYGKDYYIEIRITSWPISKAWNIYDRTAAPEDVKATFDLFVKQMGNSIILSPKAKRTYEDFDKNVAKAKQDKIDKDKALKDTHDSKGWSIRHSVPDYEHEGDIDNEEGYILAALKRHNIDRSKLKFDYDVENGGDESDGSAIIIISGKGHELYKQVDAALEDLY